MDWGRYKSFLLQSIPGAKPAGDGSEINCRCMDCSDSTNPRSAHMYISIPNNQKEPSKYYCHKCGSHGYVDHMKLLSWGLFDKEIGNELYRYNRSIMHIRRNNKYFNQSTYLISNRNVTQDEKTEEKRRYISNRLGIDFSFSDLRELKICLNLLDLLNENKHQIERWTRDRNIINDLDREFIGFLSIDNAYLSMRRTCREGMVYKSIDERYINYKIFDKFSTEQRFYTIPTVIDLNKAKRVNLHVAEGPFDILSIYLNLRQREEGIYTSITGNNPLSVMLYFLTNISLPYVKIHYYVDNDKFGRMGRVRWIMSQLPYDMQRPIYIHRNMYENEKDFGVPLNHIKESIMRL